MDWLKFLKAFARNIVMGVVLCAAALGLFGWLLAGTEGLTNGAIWGAALGLVGGAMGGFLWAGKYWSDFAGRAGQVWLQDQMEGHADDEEQRKSGRDRRW